MILHKKTVNNQQHHGRLHKLVLYFMVYESRLVFLNLFELTAHTLHQKKFGGTPKNSKIKKTSKNSCFTLNKLKLSICVQSNCANNHLQTTKIQLMHTGLTVFLNIGSKISQSNREKFGGTLCRSSRHTSVPRQTG